MADATLTDLIGAGILLQFDASDSASLFEDTSGTDAAEDGDTVKCWKPSLLSSRTGNLTEATNGPTYRVDYSGSGYPALEFDGSNDQLTRTATGNLTDGCKVIMCWTRANTVSLGRYFQIGADFSNCLTLYRSNATLDGIQVRASAANTILSTCSIPNATGRQVVVGSFTSGQLQSINVGTGSSAGAAGIASLATTYTDQVIVGVGNISQFVDMALHELIIISSECELGQVIRAAKLIRNKWGVTDPNPTPQADTGGSTLIVIED